MTGLRPQICVSVNAFPQKLLPLFPACKVHLFSIRSSTHKYISIFPVFPCVGTIRMKDGAKQQIGKLPAKPINHALGYAKPAISQIRKEFPAFVDGSAAVVIQQEQEDLDASPVIHLVHNAGGKCEFPYLGVWSI